MVDLGISCEQERVLKALVVSKGEADFSKFPEGLLERVTDSNGNVILYIDPNKYNPIIIDQGSQFVPTGGEAFLDISLVRKGFSVEVDYSESFVRHLIHIIARTALAERYLVEIDDYVGPEQNDIEYEEVITNQVAIDNYMGPGMAPDPIIRYRVNENSKTRRGGIIQVPITYKGSIGDYTQGGFSFTFVEKNLRYV